MGLKKELLKLLAKHEDEPEEHVGIELAAGETTEVECARSGSFKDLHGQPVPLTAKHLAEMEFDESADHLLKKGHVPTTSDSPLYGRVTGLRYDEKKDRLLASVVPTPAGVRINQEEGFQRCSGELTYLPKEDRYSFRHLSLLAAKRPAVSGLAEIALSEPDGDEQTVFLTLGGASEQEVNLADLTAAGRKKAAAKGHAMPDGSFPIENATYVENAVHDWGRAGSKPAVKAHIISRAKAIGATNKLPADWEGSTKKAMASGPMPGHDEGEEGKMPENELALAKEEVAKLRGELDRALAETKSDREALGAEIKRLSAERVKRAMDANLKKIRLAARPAFEALMTHLASEDRETPTVIELAQGEGKAAVKCSRFDLLLAALENQPDLLKSQDTTETTKAGDARPATNTGDLPKLALAGASTTPDGDELFLEAQDIISAQKETTGRLLPFNEAVEKALRQRSAGN